MKFLSNWLKKLNQKNFVQTQYHKNLSKILEQINTVSAYRNFVTDQIIKSRNRREEYNALQDSMLGFISIKRTEFFKFAWDNKKFLDSDTVAMDLAFIDSAINTFKAKI